MNQNLMAEILKIEDEANDIIYDARKKAGLIEAEVEKEVERVNIELEKEFSEKVNMLKEKIQISRKEEESRLKGEFEESKKKLKQIDQEVLEEMIMLVFKKICEA
jgi:vacuolar-type H+-ATPase subunit H